jgi:hypothetical protein
MHHPVSPHYGKESLIALWRFLRPHHQVLKFPDTSDLLPGFDLLSDLHDILFPMPILISVTDGFENLLALAKQEVLGDQVEDMSETSNSTRLCLTLAIGTLPQIP